MFSVRALSGLGAFSAVGRELLSLYSDARPDPSVSSSDERRQQDHFAISAKGILAAV